MSTEGEWEGIAESWCADTGCVPPVSGARELRLAGYRLVADGRHVRAATIGDVVYYAPGLPDPVLQFCLLHELGHGLCRDAGCDSEEAASYVAAAIAMPRRDVKRVVKRVGFDLPLVRFAFADSMSSEVVGRRLVDVYPHLVLSVWVDGRMTIRYSRCELPSGLADTSEDEARAAREARDETESGGWSSREGIGAWRVEERRGVAVFVLADLEMLGDRLALAAGG